MTQQAPGGPTVRRMLVGSRLRRLRIEAGISREQAGEAIRASEWKIHRLENGQVGFKERDIVDLLTLYGADPGEVAAVVGMALDANDTGWWHQYGDVLPQWFRAYVDLEQAATIIRSYEGQFIPGLLQTDDYARSVIGRGLDEAASGIERRVELRAGGQAAQRHPPGAALRRRGASRHGGRLQHPAVRRRRPPRRGLPGAPHRRHLPGQARGRSPVPARHGERLRPQRPARLHPRHPRRHPEGPGRRLTLTFSVVQLANCEGGRTPRFLTRKLNLL